MTERAHVREVGLRDGLQSIAEILPTEQKIAWLDAEHAAGVSEIEVSSFVPPKLLPQLADAEAVVRWTLARLCPSLTDKTKFISCTPSARPRSAPLRFGISADTVSPGSDIA